MLRAALSESSTYTHVHMYLKKNSNFTFVFFSAAFCYQDTAAQIKKKNLFVGDSSWPLQRGLPTQQLSSNEGEVMSVRLRRIVMPNVHPGCYSEPLLSEVLAHFWLHKTRGVDHPKKNLVPFPFEYKSHLTPDNSKRWKIFQQTASQGLRIVGFYFCAESIRRMSWMEDST